MALTEEERKRRKQYEEQRQKNIEASQKKQGTPAETLQQGATLQSRPTGTPASANKDITNLPNKQASAVQDKNAQAGLNLKASQEKQQQTQEAQAFLQNTLAQRTPTTQQQNQQVQTTQGQVAGFREQIITDEFGNQQKVQVPVTNDQMGRELGNFLGAAALGIGATPALQAGAKVFNIGKGTEVAVSAEKVAQNQAINKVKSVMQAKVGKFSLGGVLGTGATFFGLNKFLNSPKARISSIDEDNSAAGELINQVYTSGKNTGDVVGAINELQTMSDSLSSDEEEILYLRSKSLETFTNPEFADKALTNIRKYKKQIENAQFLLAQQGVTGQAADTETLALFLQDIQ